VAKKDNGGLEIGANTQGKQLRVEIERLRNRHHLEETVHTWMPRAGVLVLTVAVLLYFALGWTWALVIGLLYGLIGLLPLVFPSKATLTAQIEFMEGAELLLSTGGDAKELRAERLFKVHEIDLKRYYALTLRNANLIFVVGVGCVLLGFALVVAALYMIWTGGVQTEEAIIISSLAGAAALLSDVVAVVYLRMFSESLKSLETFHQKLVGTNHLYFANLLITKISAEAIREKAYADAALAMVGSARTSAEDAQS
jgi:integral membrane sensor domain MASE1